MLGVVEAGLARWAGFCFARPRLTLVTALLAAALFGWLAITRLGVDTDTSNMIDPNLPHRVAQAEFNEQFPDLTRNIVVVVRSPIPDEADAFAAALIARLDGEPAVGEVFAAALDPFFRENGLLFVNPQELDDTVGELSLAAPLLERLAADPSLGAFFDAVGEGIELAEEGTFGIETLDRVLRDVGDVVAARLAAGPDGPGKPLSWQLLLDDEAAEEAASGALTLRTIQVTPVFDFTRLQPVRGSHDAVQAALADVAAQRDWLVETGVTGDPVLRLEELRSVSEGIGLSFALSGVLVTILLLFAFRSVLITAMVLLAIVIALLVTAGITALTIGALNLVSVAFTVLLLGLGVDFAIHFGLHVQERQAMGEPREAAIASAVREVGAPLALCMPTTALGFLAFTPTAFVGMAQLGIIAAVGVGVAFLVTVSLLPPAIRWAGQPRPRAAPPGLPPGLRRAQAGVAILTLALTGAALFVLPQVRFNSDPMALRNPDSASVQAFDWLLADEDARPYRLSLLREDLASADAMAAQMKALPEVHQALSLASFVPDEQAFKLDLIDFAAAPLEFALFPDAVAVPMPLARGLARLQDALQTRPEDPGAQRLASLLDDVAANPALLVPLADDLLRYWPQTLSLLRAQLEIAPVTVADVPPAITKRYVAADGRQRVEIVPAMAITDAASRDAFIAAVRSVAPDIVGEALQVSMSGKIISGAMIEATGTALVLVGLFLLVFIRKVRLVLLILMPIAMAAILTSALGQLIGLPYNFANVIVLPLLIGLGIDSAIHLAWRGTRMDTPSDALATSTPRAIIFSTLTTVAAFGSLMLSEHRGTASMGALLALAIGISWICVLVVMPAVMDFLDRRGRRHQGH